MRSVLDSLPPKLLLLSKDLAPQSVDVFFDETRTDRLRARVKQVAKRIGSANFTGAGDQKRVTESAR